MSDLGDHNETTTFKLIVAEIRKAYLSRESNVPVSLDMWTDDRLGLKKMGDSPRVGFIRASGALRNTDQGMAPHKFFNTEDESGDEFFFTARYEDIAIVEMHVVGHDGCQTENLWQQCIRAVRATLGQHSMPTAYTWPTQEADGAAHTQAGQEKVIQLFDWRLLVPDEIGTMTQLAAVDSTGKFGDTAKTWGQP